MAATCDTQQQGSTARPYVTRILAYHGLRYPPARRGLTPRISSHTSPIDPHTNAACGIMKQGNGGHQRAPEPPGNGDAEDTPPLHTNDRQKRCGRVEVAYTTSLVNTQGHDDEGTPRPQSSNMLGQAGPQHTTHTSHSTITLTLTWDETREAQ